MLKLIKYEIQTVWKDLIVNLAIILLLNLALLTRINVWRNEVVFGLSCLIFFGGLVAIFIGNIRMFTRDLKENTGYLLFTIPQGGYSILGEKLIVVLISLVLTSIVGMIFVSVSSSLVGIKLFNGFGFGTVLQIVGDIYQYISLIVLIYFIIAFTKMIMKGRRLSSLVEVLIFAVFGFLSYQIEKLIAEILPYRANIAGGSVNLQMAEKVNSISYGNVSFNIANGVFELVVTIVLFAVTAYILEKKIEL